MNKPSNLPGVTALVDVVCVCSFYSFMNRYVDGTGLKSAPDELRSMGRQLAAPDAAR